MIISITNQKGGVGKSTTAYALGTGLKQRGFKVLLIDFDAQGNITNTANTEDDTNSIYDVMLKKVKAAEAIQQTLQTDILIASRNLTSLNMELNGPGKEFRLKEILENLKSIYDFIIIDTPPALDVLTINALTASDNVIIPSQADIYSLQGIGQLYETIQAVKQYCNKDLKISGILLTRFNSRNILSRDMVELIKETAKQINTSLYNSVIRECISIKEAQASQQNIFNYAPKSNAAIDYNSFISEFLGSVNNG